MTTKSPKTDNIHDESLPICALSVGSLSSPGVAGIYEAMETIVCFQRRHAKNADMCNEPRSTRIPCMKTYMKAKAEETKSRQ